MLKLFVCSALFTTISAHALAQEQGKPPKGPAPRFVTVKHLDLARGEVIVSEECLPHPNVVSRTITKPEQNRRDEPLEIGGTLKIRVHYYTTPHKLLVKHITLYDASGKKLLQKDLWRLKPGTMVLMSGDGHPVEQDYLRLIRPDTLILVVAVEALPSPFESPESTDGIIKELGK